MARDRSSRSCLAFTVHNTRQWWQGLFKARPYATRDMMTPGELTSGGLEVSDIYSETLRVEKKVFYLDLKRNSRGTFLKLSEKGANRERSTIAAPGSGIAWFRELFGFYANELTAGRALPSKELPLETKVFQFGAGRNSRGTFLRISETGPKGRTAIVVPDGLAEGPKETNSWELFRQALAKLAEHLPVTQNISLASVSGPGTLVGPPPPPPVLTATPGEGTVLRIGHKRFYFDLGSNQRGVFLRLTEMVGADRLSLVVPVDAVQQFGEAVLTQHQRAVTLQAHGIPPGRQMMAAEQQRQQLLPPPMAQQGNEGLAQRFTSLHL
ncbi:hypothetical protein WJX74_010381 [Apatococcus lobatus]|uniref:Uncharacterized protein n=1 Tax=Apatococcus lobatus TaxID=904363 RepID=A0AAW1SCQ8_9CHLO